MPADPRSATGKAVRRCASCGASVEILATQCPFCRSQVAIESDDSNSLTALSARLQGVDQEMASVKRGNRWTGGGAAWLLERSGLSGQKADLISIWPLPENGHALLDLVRAAAANGSSANSTVEDPNGRISAAWRTLARRGIAKLESIGGQDPALLATIESLKSEIGSFSRSGRTTGGLWGQPQTSGLRKGCLMLLIGCILLACCCLSPGILSKLLGQPPSSRTRQSP